MDGRLRTPIHVETWGNTRTSVTDHNPVSRSLTNNRRPDYCADTDKPSTGYYFDRTCHQSTTIYKEGGSSPGIPKVRQGIQRRRIKALSAQMCMGSRHRIQKRCPGSN